MDSPLFCAYDCIIIKGHVFSLKEDLANNPCEKCKLAIQCSQFNYDGICFIHGDDPNEYYSEVGEVLAEKVRNTDGTYKEILTINFY